MDLLQELLLTLSLSILLAFLLSRIAPAAPRRAPIELGQSEPVDTASREGLEVVGAVEVDGVHRRSVDVRSDAEAEVAETIEMEEIAVEDVEKIEEREMVAEEEVQMEEREAVVEEEEEVEDWEGVERSELGKLFGVAVAFGDSEVGVDVISKLSGEVQMELYALRKVAMEGPCYENQPLALKVSARARWHAWQKLGNMDPKAAMEQYINLLSEKVPGWMEGEPRVGNVRSEGGTASVVMETLTTEGSLEQNKLPIKSEGP